jgi:hypothetical protein
MRAVTIIQKWWFILYPGLVSGVYGSQNGTGAEFLVVLRFLLPIVIPSRAQQNKQTQTNSAVIGPQATYTD